MQVIPYQPFKEYRPDNMIYRCAFHYAVCLHPCWSQSDSSDWHCFAEGPLPEDDD